MAKNIPMKLYLHFCPVTRMLVFNLELYFKYRTSNRYDTDQTMIVNCLEVIIRHWLGKAPPKKLACL